MKKPNPLPTFVPYKLDPQQGMVISSDHHLTNTKATREYDINEMVLYINWLHRMEVEWLLNGDTFDWQGCFFQQVGEWSDHFRHVYKLVVNPGNHDEYLWWLNKLSLQNIAINDKLGYRIEWGERTVFVTHGHNPWDDFWTNSVVRQGLGKAILSASTHAQQLIGPKTDEIIMAPLIWLEKHVLPRGQRLGKEKYIQATLDVLIANPPVSDGSVVVFGHTHDPLMIEIAKQDYPHCFLLNPASWTSGFEDETGQQHKEAYQGCIWLDPLAYPKMRFGRFINGTFEEMRLI